MSRRLLLAFVLGMALPLPAQDAGQIVRLVDAHYNHLNSLKARYSEHYSGLGMDRTETGTLLLKKPGKMRWAYDEPPGKVFVLDGKFAWFFTPGDGQAQRVPAKQLDDVRSPLRFLLGHTQLNKELDGLAVVARDEGFRISGVPKGMQQKVKLLTLDVTASGRISAMRLEELDGSATEFSFSDMQENVALQNSEFTFVPPPGISVVEGLPPI